VAAVNLNRRVGVNIPLFSLRSMHDWGCGEIPDLVAFSAWAARAGFSLVQLLPFHEIWPQETSPYSALTAFALDPVFLAFRNVEDFAASGGLATLAQGSPGLLAEMDTLRNAPAVQWQAVRSLKGRAAEQAFNHFLRNEWEQASSRGQQLAEYIEAERSWIDDFALYRALSDAHGPNWGSWPEAIRDREPGALREARSTLKTAILKRQYLEWQLNLQWQAARAEAEKLGVGLAGDLPFVVSRDAADVWANPQVFCKGLRLGVPPDAFSADGQDWGLPVFDWRRMVRTRFDWIKRRAARAGKLCSLWRVDHAVGLFRSYYRRDDGGPPGYSPQSESQHKWLGPRVFAALVGAGEIVAEDLGDVPDWTRALLTRDGIPGYRVMRWENDQGIYRDPAGWPALSVATTGTHDTESLAEWYDTLRAHERQRLFALPGLRAFEPDHAFDARLRDALLGAVYGSGSALAIVPFGDLSGSRDRVNVPGTIGPHNWTYRMDSTIEALASDTVEVERLWRLARESNRVRPSDARPVGG